MNTPLTSKSAISTCKALAIGCQLFTIPAMASFVDDSTLDVKLRNEYRNAERPSASDGVYGPKIDAWIQGFLFDFETGKVADTINVQAGTYHIEKLRAAPDKSTRFYLDGHDSFTLNYANIGFDFGDSANIKIGQFGTDFTYGALKYNAPLVAQSSVRTVPTLNEGVLYEGNFGNFHLYGMYSQKYAGGYYQNWTDEGLVTSMKLAPSGDKYLMEIDKRPTYSVSGVWDNQQTQLSLGASYQEDLSWQMMTRGSYIWNTPDLGFVKAEYVGFYAQSIGLSEQKSIDDNTYAVSGQLLWNKDAITVMGSFGQVGKKIPGNPDIDTDIGFSFDQSIDRNHYDMFSWQLGSFYKLSNAVNFGLALVVTDGFEDRDHKVNVEGLGANFIFNYIVPTGPLSGLKASAILNKAQEYREGSKLGDELDYYDIKLTLHYDFNLF